MVSGALLTALVLLTPIAVLVLVVKGVGRATEIGVGRSRRREPVRKPVENEGLVRWFDLDDPEPDDR